MKLKKKCLKQIVAGVLSLVMVLSLLTGYELKKTVKASDSFPTSGVHTGTLSHGGYHRLSGLYASTNAKVCEADTMSSEGDSRAAFCMSPGVGETTKAGAYKSSTYQSGYGIKYYKALIAFYYDTKDNYKSDAVRYATQFFVWRTVVLERNHKGNFAASAYDGSGFKSGFIASLKSLTGYNDATVKAIYDKAYKYIVNGADGDYNNKVSLLKWVATYSQTMLTGKGYSDKSVKIKINKDLDQRNSGISLAGTKYEIRENGKSGKKIGTFTLDKHGIDTIRLTKDGAYKNKVSYYIKETKNVAGTTSNEKKKAMFFSIDWEKIKDGSQGATLSLGSKGIVGTKPSYLVTDGTLTDACKTQLVDNVPHVSISVHKFESGTNKNLANGEFTIYAYNSKTAKYDTKVSTRSNLGNKVTNPIITDISGNAKSTELYYTSKNLGKFKIVETKAPANHINSKASKTFNVKSGNGVTTVSQSVKFNVSNDTVTENPKEYPVYLEKINSETNTPLFTAELEISCYKNKTDGKYYKLGTVDDGTPQYDMYWADTTKIQQSKMEDGTLLNSYKTEDLEAGRTYQIVETKRPQGCATDGGYWGFGHGVSGIIHTLADYDKNNMNMIITFNLNSDGSIEILNSKAQVKHKQNYTEPIVVENHELQGEVKVVKKDDTNGAAIPGTSFEMWEVTKEEYEKEGYVPSAENNDVLAGAGETDENGELTFGKRMSTEGETSEPQYWRENGTILAEHYYLLVETKAAEGYRMPENNIHKIYIDSKEAHYTMSSFENSFEKEVVVENHPARLDLNLHKVSESRTGKESVALPGAKFALYKVQKIITDEAVNDNSSSEDSNNDGIDDKTEEAIGNDTAITTQSDTGATDEKSDAVDYSELTNENYIDFDYSKLTPVADNIVTDENGNANVPEIMEAGGYVLVETQAPKNYLVAEPQYIFIDANTLTNTTSYEIEVRDKEFESRLHIQKVNAKTGKAVKLAGIGFKVKNLDTNEYVKQTVDYYKEADIEGAPHELIKSEETDTFYTDENGELTLPNVLPIGNYQLEETVPPKGFLINTEPIKFTVDDEMDFYPDDPNKQFDYDENTRDVVINLTFKDDPTTTSFSKEDVGGKEVPGAHLKVWYEDDNGKEITADSWISTNEKHVIYGLIPGVTYHMTETIPAPGYATAKDVVFTVQETAEEQHIKMVDETIKIKIVKVEKGTKKLLPNAVFTFADRANRVIAKVKTDEKGEAYIEQKLVAGETYTVTEVKAPALHQAIEPFKYTVKDTGEVQVLQIANAKEGETTVPVTTTAPTKTTKPNATTKPTSYDAPQTGGQAIRSIFFIYAIGMAIGIIVLTLMRRRVKVENEDKK